MTNTQGLGQGSLTLLILGSMAFDSGARHAPFLANDHPHSPNLIGHQVSTGPPHKNLHQDPCGGWSKPFCPWCSPELTWHDLLWGLLSSCPLCLVVQLLFPQSLRTGRGELSLLLLSGQDCSKVQMPWSVSRFCLLIRFFLMAKSYSECQMLTITSISAFLLYQLFKKSFKYNDAFIVHKFWISKSINLVPSWMFWVFWFYQKTINKSSL